jgi:hypothetical protein
VTTAATGTGEGVAASVAAAGTSATAGDAGAAASAAAAAKDGGAAAAVAAPVVPEKYADFKLPEGVTLEAEQLTELHSAAKELGLSQEAAQKLVDRTVKDRQATEASFVAKQQAAVKQAAVDWKTQTEADPEVGGAAIKENLAVAIKARDQFATPELTKMLNESGLGNHPEVVRFFFKVGKAMSEDKFTQGGKAPAGVNPDAARAARMYPSMAQK